MWSDQHILVARIGICQWNLERLTCGEIIKAVASMQALKSGCVFLKYGKAELWADHEKQKANVYTNPLFLENTSYILCIMGWGSYEANFECHISRTFYSQNCQSCPHVEWVLMKLFSFIHQTGEEEGKEKHHFVSLSLRDKLKILHKWLKLRKVYILLL